MKKIVLLGLGILGLGALALAASSSSGAPPKPADQPATAAELIARANVILAGAAAHPGDLAKLDPGEIRTLASQLDHLEPPQTALAASLNVLASQVDLARQQQPVLTTTPAPPLPPGIPPMPTGMVNPGRFRALADKVAYLVNPAFAPTLAQLNAALDEVAQYNGAWFDQLRALLLARRVTVAPVGTCKPGSAIPCRFYLDLANTTGPEGDAYVRLDGQSVLVLASFTDPSDPRRGWSRVQLTTMAAYPEPKGGGIGYLSAGTEGWTRTDVLNQTQTR